MDPNKVKKSSGFLKAERKAKDYLDNPDKMKGLLDNATKKASKKSKKLSEILKPLKACFRLLKAYANNTYREVSWKSLLMIVASILYFVMPIDLIPDFIIGIGWLDDIALLGWTINACKKDIDKFVEWEKKRVKRIK